MFVATCIDSCNTSFVGYKLSRTTDHVKTFSWVGY